LCLPDGRPALPDAKWFTAGLHTAADVLQHVLCLPTPETPRIVSRLRSRLQLQLLQWSPWFTPLPDIRTYSSPHGWWPHWALSRFADVPLKDYRVAAARRFLLPQKNARLSA